MVDCDTSCICSGKPRNFLKKNQSNIVFQVQNLKNNDVAVKNILNRIITSALDLSQKTVLLKSMDSKMICKGLLIN